MLNRLIVCNTSASHDVFGPVHSADIDECSTRPCGANATCENIVGSFRCTCNRGYSKNGTNCIGMFYMSCNKDCMLYRLFNMRRLS